jgi:hypothetical protein
MERRPHPNPTPKESGQSRSDRSCVQFAGEQADELNNNLAAALFTIDTFIL